MRIGVADPLLLLERVDPVGILHERVVAWALERVAAGGLAMDTGTRRTLPGEEGACRARQDARRGLRSMRPASDCCVSTRTDP